MLGPRQGAGKGPTGIHENKGSHSQAGAVGIRRNASQGKKKIMHISVLPKVTCPAMNCPKPGGKVRVEMSRVTSAGKSRRLEM
jgi:hypothetical protein